MSHETSIYTIMARDFDYIEFTLRRDVCVVCKECEIKFTGSSKKLVVRCRFHGVRVKEFARCKLFKRSGVLSQVGIVQWQNTSLVRRGSEFDSQCRLHKIMKGEWMFRSRFELIVYMLGFMLPQATQEELGNEALKYENKPFVVRISCDC